MTGPGRGGVLGFDRKIRLRWMDAAADWAADGLAPREIGARLDALLDGQVAGGGTDTARRKTITVLRRIWITVPEGLAPLRDDALALLRGRSGRDARLPLHWGMCLATHPFVRSTAAAVGRLLALQETVALSQISRRAAESWGERSTVKHAALQLARSFIEWDVLRRTAARGIYRAAPGIRIADDDAVGPWLLEAGLANSDQRERPFRSLVASPVFFPFRLDLRATCVARNPRLELYRQGLDEDLVVLR